MEGSSVMIRGRAGCHVPDNYSGPSLIRCLSGAEKYDREWEEDANGGFVSDDPGESRLPRARQLFA